MRIPRPLHSLPSLRCLLAAAGFAFTGIASRADGPVPAWIEKSNANAKVLLDATNPFQPEAAARGGFPGFDDKISDISPGNNERARAAEAAARDELVRRSATETDALVQQDLAILIKSANDDIETSLLREKLLLPYIDVGQLIFSGESSLLDDQVDAARRAAALIRLRRYTGLEPGSTATVDLAKARYTEALKDPARIKPFKGRVEQNLANTSRYVQGIRSLYAKYGLAKSDGLEPALAALEQQLKDYDAWVRATVLTDARTDFRLPAELYANNLKNVGLEIPPQELMQKALLAFGEIRNEMKSLAPLVAKEHGFADTDYRAVIHALKKDQLAKDQVEPYYHEVLGQIEDIIRRESIVTVPDRAMLMRVASEAENAAQPAPHMQPPPLANNHGERGTFVLTTGNPPVDGGQTVGYDDFTFKAAAWTLTAHEGRPGHELQFSAMVERGVSEARSIFAFNSVNVEGWALYAEAEMRPYEPLDGQLVALSARLLRAARAFLDPMLNLGLISPARAHDILTQDVCLSEAMARQEVDRYTFRSPGQATAYFYGYLKIMELRTATEVTLGPKFDRKAFNNFIIGQGLLPPELLAKAVKEQFIPTAQAAK
jgi:uncharacterized protein (DUF885 family)